MTEPIQFTTVRYRCPHCRKSWAHKAGAAKHMPLCFANPGRRTCMTCAHDQPARYDHAADKYHERSCALGRDQGPSCVGCGAHPEMCRCAVGLSRPPARQLRVLCPAWQLAVVDAEVVDE